MVVTIRTVHPLPQTDQLQNGDLDCVISEKLSPDPEVEFTPLFESQLQIVVSSDHRWIRQQRIPLDELCKEPCMLPERFSPLRKAIDWYFPQKKGLRMACWKSKIWKQLERWSKRDWASAFFPPGLSKAMCALAICMHSPPDAGR
jgi:DNA-binding transcriptional LysR family regulator